VIDTNLHWPGEGTVFSVDAETDWLYGATFAIGVTVRWLGQEIARFVGRCPYTGANGYVIEKILPAVEQLPMNFNSSEELEEAFWVFWLQHRENALPVAHCASPVETGLFRRCVERDLTAREWNGPYPAIHDVASLLALLGEPADSVDAYVSKWQLEVPQGQVHDPFYDAVVSALVFEHAWRRLMSK